MFANSNIIPSTKRGERHAAIEVQKLDGPQSKVKVHKILSQPRDI